MKRMKREERGRRPPYIWHTRWVVYESEAKKAIEKAYAQGRADAIKDARAAVC
jgi:hypothetical protein